jgi:mono/diheme cytochrome c family protein
MKILTNLFLSSLLIVSLTNCQQNAKAEIAENKESEYSPILKAKYLRPLTTITYEATAEREARGKYLTDLLHCFACHSEEDMEKPGHPPVIGKEGAGAQMFKTDSTHFYSPNITPDFETGIGSLTDDMIARAIREGVGYDDRALEFMPWQAFRALTDEDVASIVVYLRSIPAISNEIPKRNLGSEAEMRLTEKSYPLTVKLDAPDFSDPVSRGKYLASAACMGCHTGWFKRNPGAYGGGFDFGGDEHTFSRNISSDITGIGAWSSETFIDVVKTGKNETLNAIMPWVYFKNLTDEDVDAIYQALMTTNPVKHSIMNGIPPTYCEVCEFNHGLGDQNKKEPLKPYKDNLKIPADLAGSYVNQLYELDTLKISYNENKLFLSGATERELFPINENYYNSDGYYAPLQFIRDQNKEITHIKFQDLGRNSYVKVKI